MAIHSFLKVERGDPDWQFSPEHYFGKEFKIIDASMVELAAGVKDIMVLRQNPTDKNMLAKHIKIQSKEDSQLDLLIINDADDKLQQIFLYDIHLCKDSSVNFGIFVKGGKFNKHIIQVSMESGSEFSTFGLMVNDVGGDTEIITKVIHENPDTASKQFIIGQAGEGSQTVFQGMTMLETDSDGSEASIENMNLISGPKGRCFSKPEIYSNCDGSNYSLGSITESLRAEKIYYLQARGLEPKKAVNTIVNNFQNQAINLVGFDDLREEIRQIFNQ
jgi:Fe-S cluster assembly scaffold protein SufB